jgi:hypothetical protein
MALPGRYALVTPPQLLPQGEGPLRVVLGEARGQHTKLAQVLDSRVFPLGGRFP